MTGWTVLSSRTAASVTREEAEPACPAALTKRDLPGRHEVKGAKAFRNDPAYRWVRELRSVADANLRRVVPRDDFLSSEERQIIASLTVGGYPDQPSFARAYSKTVKAVLANVRLPLAAIRATPSDPRIHPAPDSPKAASTAALHRKAVNRCRVYRQMILASTEAVLLVTREDAKLSRQFGRLQERRLKLVGKLKAVHAEDLGAELAARVKHDWADRRKQIRDRRAMVAHCLDALAQNLHDILHRFTFLHGEGRDEAAGQIFGALGFGSASVDAIAKRRARLKRRASSATP